MAYGTSIEPTKRRMSHKTKRKINKVLRREGFKVGRYYRRMFFRTNALILFPK